MIWILDKEPQLIAQALDDRSLSRMIKKIAQALCQVHFQWIDYHAHTIGDANHLAANIPIQDKVIFDGRRNAWADFGYKFSANYRYLCDLGMECCKEWSYRNYKTEYDDKEEIMVCNWPYPGPPHKHQHIIEWCSQNQPDLSLEIPKENPYALATTISFYREKYQHKLNKGLRRAITYRDVYGKKVISKPIIPKWSRREKPSWLILEDACT